MHKLGRTFRNPERALSCNSSQWQLLDFEIYQLCSWNNSFWGNHPICKYHMTSHWRAAGKWWHINTVKTHGERLSWTVTCTWRALRQNNLGSHFILSVFKLWHISIIQQVLFLKVFWGGLLFYKIASFKCGSSNQNFESVWLFWIFSFELKRFIWKLVSAIK